MVSYGKCLGFRIECDLEAELAEKFPEEYKLHKCYSFRNDSISVSPVCFTCKCYTMKKFYLVWNGIPFFVNI